MVMNGRKRLLDALRCEESDRVPVSIRLNPNSENVLGTEFYNYAMKKTDVIFRKGFGSFLFVDPETLKENTQTQLVDGKVIRKKTIATPKGQLTTSVMDTNSATGSWIIKPLVESEEDLEKVMSIPYRPLRPRLEVATKWFRHIGDRGLVFLISSDPVGVVAPLFSLNNFVKACYLKQSLMEETLSIIEARIIDCLEYIFTELGDIQEPLIVEVSGPEYVNTFLPPPFFRSLVVKHNRKIAEFVHSQGGLYGVHCHEKVRRILKDFVDIGADSLHPVEEPPQGDIWIDEAKEILEGKTCIIGGIQHGLLETCRPADIEASCLDVLSRAAAGGGFVLETTATPLRGTKKENLSAIIETCLKKGRYSHRPNGKS